ncbi:MAG: HAMP domain-containing histidine kinase, partial [Planctomycetes bacterium]|nr:HAMP domain-containing histidine kinase [Planctomycetota bacterium]
WMDGLYIWDGTELRVLRPTPEHAAEINRVVQARLAVRPLKRSDDHAPARTELLYDSIGSLPIVLACLRARSATGQPIVIVGHINHIRLKTDLVDPMVGLGDGLEVVPVGLDKTPWARPMQLAMRFWAIRPTEAFRREQGHAVLGQTLAYVGLTLLALATLLVAMWFLIRLARRETALAQMKADFVANVSHELKTPLALIRMFGETLESGRVTSDQKRQEYYAIIARESTRLTHLIDNILDFARIDAGRKEYTFARIDVGEVVRETYEAYRLQLDHKQFQHSLSIADDLPAIEADRDAISQVLVNLMGNSVKYSEDDRYLAIEVMPDTRRNRRGVLISVHDRGIGISPEDRRQLFEGFFRASDVRVQRREGTGLGLALLKHIVDAHGGSLDVESRLVKGTTFRVFLPVTQASRGPEADSEHGPETATAQEASSTDRIERRRQSGSKGG